MELEEHFEPDGTNPVPPPDWASDTLTIGQGVLGIDSHLADRDDACEF